MDIEKEIDYNNQRESIFINLSKNIEEENLEVLFGTENLSRARYFYKVYILKQSVLLF